MIILLQPGEILTIGIAYEDGMRGDGEFQIHFDAEPHPRELLITETAGLPGSHIGDGHGVLYREVFDNQTPDDLDVVAEANSQSQIEDPQ